MSDALDRALGLAFGPRSTGAPAAGPAGGAAVGRDPVSRAMALAYTPDVRTTMSDDTGVIGSGAMPMSAISAELDRRRLTKFAMSHGVPLMATGNLPNAVRRATTKRKLPDETTMAALSRISGEKELQRQLAANEKARSDHARKLADWRMREIGSPEGIPDVIANALSSVSAAAGRRPAIAPALNLPFPDADAASKRLAEVQSANVGKKVSPADSVAVLLSGAPYRLGDFLVDVHRKSLAQPAQGVETADGSLMAREDVAKDIAKRLGAPQAWRDLLDPENPMIKALGRSYAYQQSQPMTPAGEVDVAKRGGIGFGDGGYGGASAGIAEGFMREAGTGLADDNDGKLYLRALAAVQSPTTIAAFSFGDYRGPNDLNAGEALGRGAVDLAFGIAQGYGAGAATGALASRAAARLAAIEAAPALAAAARPALGDVLRGAMARGILAGTRSGLEAGGTFGAVARSAALDQAVNLGQMAPQMAVLADDLQKQGMPRDQAIGVAIGDTLSSFVGSLNVFQGSEGERASAAVQLAGLALGAYHVGKSYGDFKRRLLVDTNLPVLKGKALPDSLIRDLHKWAKAVETEATEADREARVRRVQDRLSGNLGKEDYLAAQVEDSSATGLSLVDSLPSSIDPITGKLLTSEGSYLDSTGEVTVRQDVADEHMIHELTHALEQEAGVGPDVFAREFSDVEQASISAWILGRGDKYSGARPDEMVRYVLETLQSDPKALKRAPAAVKRLVGIIDQRAVDLRRSNRLGYEEAARLGLADPTDVLTPEARKAGRSASGESIIGMRVETPKGPGVILRTVQGDDGEIRRVVDVDGEEIEFLSRELTVEDDSAGRRSQTEADLAASAEPVSEEDKAAKKESASAQEKAALLNAARSIEASYSGEPTPKDRASIAQRLYERSKADLQAASARFGVRPSFYKDSTREGSKLAAEYFLGTQGRKITQAEDELFHFFSAMGSPNATPTFDSNVGLRLMDRYLKSGQISAYYKDADFWDHNFLGKKSGTGIADIRDGEIRPGKVGKAYEDDTVERLNTLVNGHFKGNLPAAMEWLQTFHTPAEIEAVTGIDLPAHEYTKGGRVQGIFGIAGVKLGSYWLNRIGHLGTITKDMWVARTVARYLEHPLVTGKDKDTPITDPHSPKTVDGRMHREALDEAWNRLATEMGLTPAEIQEQLWHYEQQLYVDHGAREGSGTIQAGVRAGIEALANGEHYDNYQTGRKPTDAESERFSSWNALSSIRRELYGLRLNSAEGAPRSDAEKGNTGYTRESGSGRGKRDRVGRLDLRWAKIRGKIEVADSFSPKPEVSGPIESIGGDPISFHELAEGQDGDEAYAKLLSMAYNDGPFGKLLTPRTADDLSTMRKFLSPDGRVGFALDKDNIVAMFTLPGAGHRAIASALQLAVDQGGRRIDVFDTYQPHAIGDSGFKVVSRTPFDETQLGGAAWDYEAMKIWNDGRPDVVMMVFNPAHNHTYIPGEGTLRETPVSKAKKPKPPKFTGFDKAEKDQIKAVEKNRESLNKHFPEKSQLRYARTPEEGGPKYGQQDETGFYSRLERLILAKMPGRVVPTPAKEMPERVVSPAKEINGRMIPARVEYASTKLADTVHRQMMGLIASGDVSKDEVNLVGLEDWLRDQKGSVTRDQVLAHIRRQSPEVKVSVRESGGGLTGKELKDASEIEDAANEEWSYSSRSQEVMRDIQDDLFSTVVNSIDPKSNSTEDHLPIELSEEYRTGQRLDALKEFIAYADRELENPLPGLGNEYDLPMEASNILESAKWEAGRILGNGEVYLGELVWLMQRSMQTTESWRGGWSSNKGITDFVTKIADTFGIRMTDLEEMADASKMLADGDFYEHPRYEHARQEFIADYHRRYGPNSDEDPLDPGDTRYGEHTIPGGKDYRETVLINPEGNRSGHFEPGEQLNIRLTTRDAESDSFSGGSSFIEEAQSDIARNIRKAWGSWDKLAAKAKEADTIETEILSRFGVGGRNFNPDMLPDTPGVSKLRSSLRASFDRAIGAETLSAAEEVGKWTLKGHIDKILKMFLAGQGQYDFQVREFSEYLRDTAFADHAKSDVDVIRTVVSNWFDNTIKASPDDVRQAVVEAKGYLALRERLRDAVDAERSMKEFGRPAIGSSWGLRAIKEAIHDAIQRGNDIVAWPTGEILRDRWGNQGLETTYDEVLPNEARNLLKKYGGKVESFNITPSADSDYVKVHGFRIPDGLAEAVRNDGLPRMSQTEVDPGAFGMQRSKNPRKGDPDKANLGDLQRQADLIDRMGRRKIAAAGKTSRSWENARQAAEILRGREDIRTRLGEKSTGQGISDVELTAAYSDLNDLEAALDKHEAELELDPFDNLAKANLDEAMAQYATLSNQILDLTSNNGRNLAAARMFANRVNGDPQRALRQAKRIAKRPLKKEETKAITEAARKLQAEEEKRRSMLEAQEEELRARVELDPADTELHAQLAELYIKLGKGRDEFTDTLKKATGRDMLTSEVDDAWNAGGKQYVKAPSTPEDDAIGSAKDDLAEVIAKTSESTALEFISGMWRSGLLLSARAAQASLFGNAYGMVMESLTAMPQAFADAMLGTMTGQRTISTAGIGKLVPSAASRDAAKSALKALRTGANATEEGNDLYRRMNYRLGGYGSRTPVVDALGKILDPLIAAENWKQNKVYDVLSAADAPARRAFLERHLIEQADLQARKEGLKAKAERNRRVKEILGPSTKPELFIAAVASAADDELSEIQRNVLRSAKEREDQKVLSNSTHITKMFGKISNDPVGAFILPFSKIPTNAIAQGLEYMPTGTIYGVVRALQAVHTKDSSTQYKAATALARSMTGSGLMTAGYLLFRAGALSTSASISTNERETQEAAGIQGGSIKIGNRWYRITDSPASMALLLGAEIARQQDLQGDIKPQMVAAAALKTAANQVRQIPALQGINNISDTLTELGREGDDTDLPSAIADSKLVRGYGGSVLPAIVGDVAAFVDPFRRAGKTFKAGFEQDTPARYGMSPEYDSVGRPLLRTSGVESQVRGLSPDMSERLADKGIQEAYRLGVNISRPPKIRVKTRVDRDLSESDYQQRVMSNGLAVRSAIDELVGSEWYQKATDKDRREEMRKEVARAKTRAANRIRAERVAERSQ